MKARPWMWLPIATACLSGCYSWTEIKPSELPKLNGGTTAMGTVVSGTNRGEAIAVSVGQVERPDGRLVEIKGDYDARVVAQDDKKQQFKHPVRAELVDSTLVVQGANQASTSFDLEDVKTVEVSQPNQVLTAGVVTAGLAGGLLLLFSAAE